MECSICLEELKSPIAIPCGHVHCEACLFEHIRGCPGTSVAPCPTCRSIFHIAVPDSRLLPEKYRPFIVPTMRRVYLPLSDSAADQRALKEKIRSLERSVQLLRSDNMRLVGRCERLSDECDNLVKKEAELQRKCDSFEAKLNDAEGEILNMGDALDLTTQEADKWKAAWSALSRRHKEIRQKLEDSNSETKRKLEFTTNELRELRLQEERNQEERNQEQPQPIVPARALKRKVNQAALDSSPSSSTSPTKRVVQPFLKRPRLQCGPPPSHVSQSTQRPDPTLLFRTPSPAKRSVKRRIESDSSTEFDGSSNEESEEEDRPRRLFADYLARKRITGYLD